MIQLLTNYSLGQIFLFVVFAAIAFKQIITFLDWCQVKIKTKVHKEEQPENIAQQLHESIEQRKEQIDLLKDNQQKIEKSIQELNQKLNMLIISDRDSMKAWLTAQHHHFVEKGSIDYYSLDCISKRYTHYKEQGGNTFIDDLYAEINDLPKVGDKYTPNV